MEIEINYDIQALLQKTEPDSHALCKLVQYHANLNNFSNLDQALFTAVEQGLFNSVRVLLEAGASPNKKSGRLNESPLHVCSAREHCSNMVRELLKHGADVNAVNNDKRTPLHEAAGHQCVENMQELLKNGATVDAVDGFRETPLIRLIRSGRRVSVVQVLLRAGADVNHQSSVGLAPLHYAVKTYSPQVVRLLLQYNADANVTDINGFTPLHFPILGGQKTTEIIRELLKGGAKSHFFNSMGQCALLCAIARRNKEATQELLRSGAAVTIGCLERLDFFTNREYPEVTEIAQKLIRYAFINSSDSLERIHQLLMQGRVVRIWCKLSSAECNLESFMHACFTEVDVMSKMGCDCGKSSFWGSIMGHEACHCDTHQAILKFLFSGRKTHFTDVFFYKLSKEFLLEMTLSLILYFESKDSEKHVMLNGDCMKQIELYVSFEDIVFFLQCKQSEMGVSEFENFLTFVKGESSVKSSSEISPPDPKRRRVS